MCIFGAVGCDVLCGASASDAQHGQLCKLWVACWTEVLMMRIESTVGQLASQYSGHGSGVESRGFYSV